MTKCVNAAFIIIERPWIRFFGSKSGRSANRREPAASSYFRRDAFRSLYRYLHRVACDGLYSKYNMPAIAAMEMMMIMNTTSLVVKYKSLMMLFCVSKHLQPTTVPAINPLGIELRFRCSNFRIKFLDLCFCVGFHNLLQLCPSVEGHLVSRTVPASCKYHVLPASSNQCSGCGDEFSSSQPSSKPSEGSFHEGCLYCPS